MHSGASLGFRCMYYSACRKLQSIITAYKPGSYRVTRATLKLPARNEVLMIISTSLSVSSFAICFPANFSIIYFKFYPSLLRSGDS